MCWASCSLRYWDRRTCSSESLRGDSASAASTHTVRVAMGGGVQGRESDPGIVTVKRGSDGKDSLGWTWTMTSNLHVTTVSNYKYFSCREDNLRTEPLRMKGSLSNPIKSSSPTQRLCSFLTGAILLAEPPWSQFDI